MSLVVVYKPEREDRLPIRASGRLGNLLFQYCLVLHARRIGRDAYLDAVRSAPLHVRDLLSVVAIPDEEIEWSRPPARLENRTWVMSTYAQAHRLAYRGVLAAERRGLLHRPTPDFVDESSLVDLIDATLAGGYFQSSELVDGIFQDLTSRLVPSLMPKLTQSRSETVLHIRMGDYSDLPGFIVLSPDYYLRALVASGGTTRDEVVIVTDSPRLVAERFDRFNIVEISMGSVGEDFVRIAVAERKAISNSTFAWWAARLGEIGGNRSVVGPRPWQPNGDGSGLYRGDWTWIDNDLASG